MQKLVHGVVLRRDNSKEIGEDGEPIGQIERRFGHRGAVVRTDEGREIHIHDRQWRRIANWGLLVPQFKTFGGNISTFPAKNGHIYALVDPDKKPGKYGPRPEATAWCRADRYHEAMQRIVARSYYRQQIQITELILQLVEATDRESMEDVHDMVSRLSRMCKQAEFVTPFIEHYLLGHPAELVNPAPS